MNPQPLNDGRYESVSEYIEAANTVCRNKKNAEMVRHFQSEDRGTWYGASCSTGKDVQRLVNEGWQAGRERVDSFLTKLEAIQLAPRDMRRRLTRGDAGDHLDIAAVYAGRHQSAWTRAKRRDGQGPQRVDIVANMLCAGADNSEVLFWRGAAAVALCDKLEAAGYMVRLIVGFGDRSGDVSCRITVKNHDMPMDLATASSVILPGFFRSIGHQWIAAHNTHVASWGGISVGKCKLETGEIFLSHEVNNESSAKAKVESVIRGLEKSEDDEAA